MRESEFRDLQLQQLTDRLHMQDELITRLQEEVLYCYQHNETTETKPKIKPRKNLPSDTKPVAAARKPTKNRETQTVEPQPESPNAIDPQPSDAIVEVEPDTSTRDLNLQLKGAFDQLNSKELVVQQLCTKVADLEASLSMLRTQMGDKVSQISFYEKHIMDLQGKVKKLTAETGGDPEVRVAEDGQTLGEPDNLIVMKVSLNEFYVVQTPPHPPRKVQMWKVRRRSSGKNTVGADVLQ